MNTLPNYQGRLEDYTIDTSCMTIERSHFQRPYVDVDDLTSTGQYCRCPHLGTYVT